MTDNEKMITDKEFFLTAPVTKLIDNHILTRIIAFLSLFSLLASIGIYSFLSNLENRIATEVKTSLKNDNKAFVQTLYDQSVSAGMKVVQAEKEADKALVLVGNLVDKTKKTEKDLLQAQKFADTAAKSANEIARVLLKDPSFREQVTKSIVKQDLKWIAPNLSSNWVNYGNTYNPIGYYKDNQGIVRLRGLIKGGQNESIIFNLPDEYRPEFRVLSSAIKSGNTLGRVDILQDGNVYGMSSSSSWLSLDGISFKAK